MGVRRHAATRHPRGRRPARHTAPRRTRPTHAAPLAGAHACDAKRRARSAQAHTHMCTRPTCTQCTTHSPVQCTHAYPCPTLAMCTWCTAPADGGQIPGASTSGPESAARRSNMECRRSCLAVRYSFAVTTPRSAQISISGQHGGAAIPFGPHTQHTKAVTPLRSTCPCIDRPTPLR